MKNFNLLIIVLVIILVIVVKLPDGSTITQRVRKALFATMGGTQ